MAKQHYSYDLKKQGGVWLGAARSWMQHNLVRGDSVEWGSHECLADMTPAKIEDLAATVAAAVMNELEKQKGTR